MLLQKKSQLYLTARKPENQERKLWTAWLLKKSLSSQDNKRQAKTRQFEVERCFAIRDVDEFDRLEHFKFHGCCEFSEHFRVGILRAAKFEPLCVGVAVCVVNAIMGHLSFRAEIRR